MMQDARDSLHACSAPILFMAGAHDRVVPRQNAEAITWGSKTQAVIITGSHLAMYTKPTAAATAISGVCGTTIESPGVSLFASFPSYEGVCDVNGSRRG